MGPDPSLEGKERKSDSHPTLASQDDVDPLCNGNFCQLARQDDLLPPRWRKNRPPSTSLISSAS